MTGNHAINAEQGVQTKLRRIKPLSDLGICVLTPRNICNHRLVIDHSCRLEHTLRSSQESKNHRNASQKKLG